MTAKNRKNAPTQAIEALTTPVIAPVGKDVLLAYEQLRISEQNQRTKHAQPTDEEIAELAALIENMGLLHRLLVVKEGDGYGVVAGGRRLVAIGLLIAQGRWPAEVKIECRLFDSAEAVRISLAENLGRKDMHPAEQIVAFRNRIDGQGKSVAEVAREFGVTPLTVERRLKLARLAPRFLKMYRDGEIASDVLLALAQSDDHAVQEAAWEAMPRGSRSAYHLRNLITKDEAPLSHRFARYVGVKGYEKAGGIVRRDLFSDSNDGYIQNMPLLRKLADDKLQRKASEFQSEGWSWVECDLDADATEYRNFGREAIGMRKLTAAEARKHQQLADAMEAAEKAQSDFEVNADDSDEQWETKSAALDDACRASCKALQEFEEAVQEWTADQKARAGVVLRLDYSGKLIADVGLVKPSDKKAVARSIAAGGGEVPFAVQKGLRAEYSDRHMRDMTSHRTAALQATLSKNHRVALVSLLHVLVMQLFSARGSYRGSPLNISLEATKGERIAQAAPTYAESPAGSYLEPLQEKWASMLPESSCELFAWLLRQEGDTLAELLSFCVARSLNVVRGDARKGRDDSDMIADALQLDMAQYWTATPATFFSAVSKAKGLQTVSEATGADPSSEASGMKKADVDSFCASKLAGTGWLPGPLRSVPAVHEAPMNAESAAE